MKTTAILLVCLCAAILPTAAQATADAGSALERQKSAYRQALAKLERDYKTRVAALPTQYIAALDSLEKSSRQKGSLDNVIAIRAEQKRFEKTKTVNEDDLVTEPPELRELQTKYRSRLTQYEIDKHKQVIAYANKQVTILDNLEKDLTKKGKLDEALAVRTEKDKVRSGPEYKNAEFVLADAEAQKKRTQAPEPEAAKATLPAWEQPGGPGVIIYKNGVPAGKSAEESVKRLDAIGYTDRSHDRRRIAGKFALVKKKGGEEGRYVLRAALACRSATDSVAKPTLVVDYYAKPAKISGHITADKLTRARRELIKLPNMIGQNKVILDTAGIPKPWDFYDVVISLFDGEAVLLYQVVPRSILADLAPAELPTEAHEVAHKPPEPPPEEAESDAAAQARIREEARREIQKVIERKKNEWRKRGRGRGRGR